MASEYIQHPYPSAQQINEFRQKYPYVTIDIRRDTNTSMAVLIENEKVLKLIETFKERYWQGLSQDRQDQGMPGSTIDSHFMQDLLIRVNFISWNKNPLTMIQKCSIPQGVDIVQIGSTWTAYLAQKGILKDITDFIFHFEGEYTPSLLKSCRMEGNERYYAIPWSLDIRTWFYNKKLFDEAGIYPEKSPISLERLEDVCRRLMEKHSKREGFFPLCVPTDKNDYSTLHSAMPWIIGNGGRIIDIQKRRGDLLDQRVIKGISEYVKLGAKGYIPLPFKNRSYSLLDVQNAFLEEKTALIFIGPWIKDAIESSPHPERFRNIGLIKAQCGECPATIIGGSHLAIVQSKRSNNEERACEELIKYLSVNGGLGLGISPCKEELKRLLYSEDEAYIKPCASILLFQEAEAYPALPEWGDIEQSMILHIARIWERIGEETIQWAHAGKDLNEQRLEYIVKDELRMANKSIDRVFGGRENAIHIFFIAFILGFFVIVFIIIYHIKIFFYLIKVEDVLKRFHEAKDILHRTKITRGQVTTIEDQKRWRAILSGDSARAAKILEDLEKTGRYLSILSKIRHFSKEEAVCIKDIAISSGIIRERIHQYIITIVKEYDSVKDFEREVIDFFVKNLKTCINSMADILDRYYLDSSFIRDIFDDLKVRFDLINDQDINEVLENSRIIIPVEEFESCLVNIILNARDAVSNTPEWEIKVTIMKKDEYLELHIKDNGRGISGDELKNLKEGLKGVKRLKGHGLNDVCYHLRNWGGDIDVSSNGEGFGAEFILRLRIV